MLESVAVVLLNDHNFIIPASELAMLDNELGLQKLFFVSVFYASELFFYLCLLRFLLYVEFMHKLIWWQYRVNLIHLTVWEEPEVTVRYDVKGWPVLRLLIVPELNVVHFADVDSIKADPWSLLDHVLPAGKLFKELSRVQGNSFWPHFIAASLFIDFLHYFFVFKD